ncbi:Ger(x)C family spore germination protein [Falsibacillus albus]|nr:Ger(x)C family spore germination protein [Falsibacillus albus]
MKKFLISFLICSIILSGCGSQHEINEMSIIIGVGIDMVDDSTYQLTLQIVNPSAIVAGGNTTSGPKAVPIINVVGKGQTVVDALQSATTKVSRPNFYAHLSLIVIGQALAEKGILEVLDTFERDSQVRQNTPVLIARNEMAFDVLNTLTALTNIPVVSLIGKIRNVQNLFGETVDIKLYELISSFEDEKTVPILSGATAPKDDPFAGSQSNIEQSSPLTSKVNGIAVFHKNGKLNYWIDDELARTTLLLRNDLKETIYSEKCGKNKHISLNVSYSKSDSSVKFFGKKPLLSVNAYLEGNIDSNGCSDITLSKDEDYKKIEQKVSKDIKNNIKQLLNVTEKHQSDFLGFGQSIRIHNPKEWKKIKSSWPETYSKADMKVKVEFHINNSGSTRNHMKVDEQD